MLRGLTTVSFWAADLAAAKKWYAELLGIDPYFERPGYAEFRLGDYQHELGLIDSRYAPDPSARGPAGAVVYWHVDDVRATLPSAVQSETFLWSSHCGVRSAQCNAQPPPIVRLRLHRSQLAVVRHTLETMRRGRRTSVGLDGATTHPAPTTPSGYNTRKAE